jgi:tRNA1(Val) A37 N6-methylase TrmN6
MDITAIELQDEIYDLGIKSLEVNNTTNIKYIKDDVKNISKYTNNTKFDYITCNPPYFQTNPDININENSVKAIARHELTITLEDIISIASKNIEYNGTFYLVHKDFRLADIIVLLNKYNFGVKRLVPIYNDENSECTSILVESVYNGKNYVKITKPVFINKYKSYKNIF